MKELPHLGPDELHEITSRTLSDYHRKAESFWQLTADHDVSQNIDAFLSHIRAPAPFRLLDLGCGPGRDVAAFARMGHLPTGLDGCATFCAMAREHTGRTIWHQDFLHLKLPARHFDGVFANASLFHVPTQELPTVLRHLREALQPGGVLFSSNPRGRDREGWTGERYGAHLSLAVWREAMESAGFELLHHFFRPAGEPRELQPWLATVWRTSDD